MMTFSMFATSLLAIPDTSAAMEVLGSGRGFVLEALPRHNEFALWIQFTIVPPERLVQIARIELLGPSPPPERADGPSSR